MYECDEDGADQDWCIPPRRWSWTGFAVELFKPTLGLMRATFVSAEAFHSMAESVYRDLAAHYNWTLQQNEFRDAVTRDLESL